MNPDLLPFITALLVLTSISLVAGITYIYTGRNKRLTIIFTLLSVFIILFLKLLAVVKQELNRNFLGGFDPDRHLPYVVSEPGWKLLLHTWHIWILPVIFTAIIFSFIIYLFFYLRKTQRAVASSASAFQKSAPPTAAEKMNTMMAVDGIKKESRDLKEKLSDALINNAAYEIKISDLEAELHEVRTDLEETKKNLSEEIEILQLELSAKGKENEYITEQLLERSEELTQAQEKLEKLALSTQQKLEK